MSLPEPERPDVAAMAGGAGRAAAAGAASRREFLAWLDDWVALLRHHGVRFRVGWKLKSLHMRRGRLSEARVRDPRGRMRTIHPDWFVCATPLERTAGFLTPAMLAADPRLEGIRRLRTDCMVGMQFYLRRPVPLADGHVNYVDSPFALTSISQAQF